MLWPSCIFMLVIQLACRIHLLRLNECFLLCRLSAYWLGKSPETFYRLYTGAAIALFGTRLFIYRSKG